MLSHESLINITFNQVAHLPSNVGTLKSEPEGSEEQMEFAKVSKLFYDSMMFRSLYSYGDGSSKGTEVEKYIAELRDALNHIELVVESVKLTHSGQLRECDEDVYFSEHMLRRYRRLFDRKVFAPGYTAIKVSLDYPCAKKVILILANVLPHLQESFIVLHDIDFAHDCKPIYYINARVGGEVPGSQKGMFPSRDACRNGGIRKFCNVGIDAVDNISIAWPKRVHTNNSAPLAEIIECEGDEVDTNVLHMKAIRPS
ncbi:hypothetical protein K457DRAFT_1815079 [Linnemannia elongata AG-77]|uniref:Uncharacterized protein n=1 Tax=Linnemannia elongata AG-77 TaxID=1314771 RepID=A0A197KCR0_9FUNG|nr:hypothetical protein K457DRAFT_1815079 [Linnemannia elongata AG-77]